MPRFAVLRHDWPSDHYDLLMEQADSLKSWRLADYPTPGKPVAATANHDHRKLYLDHEGEVPGDRGTVTRVDGGEYEGELGETFSVEWHGHATGRATMAESQGGLWFVIVLNEPEA